MVTWSEYKICLKWGNIAHLLHCEWLYWVHSSIKAVKSALNVVVQVVRAIRYRLYSRYLLRLTVYFISTIYRGISRPWRYWCRYLSIDDKYRGIMSIAHHYLRVLTRGGLTCKRKSSMRKNENKKSRVKIGPSFVFLYGRCNVIHKHFNVIVFDTDRVHMWILAILSF